MIRGQKRNNITMQLFADGTDNFLSKNQLENETNINLNKILKIVIKLNFEIIDLVEKVKNIVFRVMKSNYIHKDRISTDIYVDSESAKLMWDSRCLYEDDKSIRGFVQEIIQNPFGCVMLSDIQVKNI